MNEANALNLLAALGVPNAVCHGEWVRSSCPLAFHRHKGGKDNSPSFGIHVEPKGKSGYLCYSCQIRSRDLADLITEIGYAEKAPAHPAPPMNIPLAQEIINAENEVGYSGVDWPPQPVVQEFEEFPLWWLESFKPVHKYPEAMGYLNMRSVPSSLWADLDLRYDTNKRMVCFPFFNRWSALAGMRGRSIVKGAFAHYDYSYNKYNNTKLVLLNENRIDWTKPVVVVEGEFDLCRVIQYYPNVVANLTATLSEPKLVTLEHADLILGFFDNDEAGDHASSKMEQRFGKKYKEVPYPNAEVKDPGEMTLKQIEHALYPLI